MGKRKKVTEKEICDGYRRLAFGEIKDAVKLLYETDEEILRQLPELDLFNVSEIKMPRGGGMEIKFCDRLKALDKLRELAQMGDSSAPLSFYDAIEKGASAVNLMMEERNSGQL